jgi:hypothetical protein
VTILERRESKEFKKTLEREVRKLMKNVGPNMLKYQLNVKIQKYPLP